MSAALYLLPMTLCASLASTILPLGRFGLSLKKSNLHESDWNSLEKVSSVTETISVRFLHTIRSVSYTHLRAHET